MTIAITHSHLDVLSKLCYVLKRPMRLLAFDEEWVACVMLHPTVSYVFTEDHCPRRKVNHNITPGAKHALALQRRRAGDIRIYPFAISTCNVLDVNYALLAWG